MSFTFFGITRVAFIQVAKVSEVRVIKGVSFLVFYFEDLKFEGEVDKSLVDRKADAEPEQDYQKEEPINKGIIAIKDHSL